ncbi:MAG: late competence development ComFB family protein [Spirochaetaceae bacterium]|nr:MAG: late competence development ComFB family protein [Spirochaetaceae bacterium]
MMLEKRYDLENIRNESQGRVYERIDKLLEEQDDICKCETCVLDLTAFILNRITPRYTTSMLGNLHPDAVFEKKIEVEIDLALRAGLKQLQEHPHHS